MDNPLDQAAHCPICESLPVASLAEILGKRRVILSCPKGHPYTFAGDTLLKAVSNWNLYIALMIQDDTRDMLKGATRNLNMSYCRSCKDFTKSITHFNKTYAERSSLGYSVVIHQCADCNLTKSEKEAA